MTDLRVGDLDHDGKLDVAVGLNPDGVQLVRGDGHGGLLTAQLVATGSYGAWGLSTYAAGSTGGMNLLAIDRADSALFTIAPDGTGGFTASSVSTPSYGNGVAAADFNRDGHIDAVAIYDSELSSFVGSSGGLSASATFGNSGGYAVEAADVNRDGSPDVLFADFYGNALGVFLNDGHGNFSGPTSYPTADASYPNSMAVGDLNGDGTPDVVLGHYYGAFATVFLGDGHGGFSAGVQYPLQSTVTGIALGDVDGDGHLDILASNATADVLLGRGDGTFGNIRPLPLPFPANTTFVRSGDFNGDGHPDIAVARVYAFHSGADVVVISGPCH